MVKVLVLAALLALGGCTTTKGSFCAIESPIRLSKATVQALSDEEARQVLAHNETGARLCSWKP